jgi:hypothetical protein
VACLLPPAVRRCLSAVHHRPSAFSASDQRSQHRPLRPYPLATHGRGGTLAASPLHRVDAPKLLWPVVSPELATAATQKTLTLTRLRALSPPPAQPQARDAVVPPHCVAPPAQPPHSTTELPIVAALLLHLRPLPLARIRSGQHQSEARQH